jgi:hypothetical protein
MGVPLGVDAGGPERWAAPCLCSYRIVGEKQREKHHSVSVSLLGEAARSIGESILDRAKQIVK